VKPRNFVEIIEILDKPVALNFRDDDGDKKFLRNATFTGGGMAEIVTPLAHFQNLPQLN
jgi:hypothetical protein